MYLTDDERRKIVLEISTESEDQILRGIIFNTKILLEPEAHAGSFRHKYALEFLQIAKEQLVGDVDWTTLPIDIDTFVLPPARVIKFKDRRLPKVEVDTEELPVNRRLTMRNSHLNFNVNKDAKRV